MKNSEIKLLITTYRFNLWILHNLSVLYICIFTIAQNRPLCYNIFMQTTYPIGGCKKQESGMKQ